jgi:hypothetical protein
MQALWGDALFFATSPLTTLTTVVDGATTGATVRSGGTGSLVMGCGVSKWVAVALAAFVVVRVPADLARRSGCCQGWPTGDAVVRREVLLLLDQDRGQRCFVAVVSAGASLALWMGLCGVSRRQRLWRCALSRVLAGRCAEGFSWAKALATVTSLGVASPVEGVMFPSFVFRGRKPGPPRTSDGGVPDVTPFLKASLLKFVSATS